VRRLTSHELVDVATELGAEAVGDVSGLVQVQQVDRLVDALASLLVAIVERRPFDRRNRAVGVASVALLARLNGRALDLSPPEDVAATIARIQEGLAASAVREWLGPRLVAEASVARCPTCAVPLREALGTAAPSRVPIPTCGLCGQVLGPPHHRSHRSRRSHGSRQEV
jgi:hypothetical protein